MVVQFFKGGRTYKGAKSAVAYLLNERLEQGTAKVYEGNPDLTLKIISQINRKWKFTSGVISFEEPYEKISSLLPQIKEEFEKTFFPGLNKDQYNILYVLHTDKGRAELHFLVPRTELTTGKDLAIYTHKKDLKKKDLFQQYINERYNLSNPLDKSKQETLKIEDKKWSNENKEFKKQIHEIIEQGVLNGLFSNREEIISFLKENGLEIKREGKNYITIINPSNNKSVRLKGEYYDENWTIDRTIEKVSRREKYTSIVRLGEELRERVERDARANRKKYSSSKRELITAIDAELAEHRLGIGTMQNGEKMDLGDRGINSRRNIDNNSIKNNKRIENDELRRDFIIGIRAVRAVKQEYLADFKELIQRTEQVNIAEYARNKEIKRDSYETRERDRTIKQLTLKATATSRNIDELIVATNDRDRRIDAKDERKYERDTAIIELQQDISFIRATFNQFVNTIKRGFRLMLNHFKYKHTDISMQQQEQKEDEKINIQQQQNKAITRTFRIRR